MASKSPGIVSIATITIILSIVIGVGIFFMLYMGGMSNIIRASEQKQINERILMLRSILSADYAYYPSGKVMLRNIGKEDLTVFRVITYLNGSLIWDSGIRNIVELKKGESKLISFQCPGCRRNDPILLAVHYVPSILIQGPEQIKPLDEIEVYKVLSISVQPPQEGALSIFCPTPSLWTIIDMVDPVEGDNLQTLTDHVRILPSDAAEEDMITIQLDVSSGGSTRSSGPVSIPSRSETDVWIDANAEGLTHPLKVSINSLEEGWVTIPDTYELWNDYGARVDYVKISWNPISKRIMEAYINIFYTEEGIYGVSLEIYDCNGNLRASGYKDVTVSEVPLAGLFLRESLLIEPVIPILEAYKIKVRIINLTPHTTTTTTITETITESVLTETTTTTTLKRTLYERTTVATTTKTKTHYTTTTTTTTISSILTKTKIKRTTTTTTITQTYSWHSKTTTTTTTTATRTYTETIPTTTTTTTKTFTKTTYTDTTTRTTTITRTATTTTTTTITITTTIFNDEASSRKLSNPILGVITLFISSWLSIGALSSMVVKKNG